MVHNVWLLKPSFSGSLNPIPTAPPEVQEISSIPTRPFVYVFFFSFIGCNHGIHIPDALAALQGRESPSLPQDLSDPLLGLTSLLIFHDLSFLPITALNSAFHYYIFFIQQYDCLG
jgi:hypothetical protein